MRNNAREIERFRIIRPMVMDRVLRNLVRAFGRIFPDCVTLSQAVAFNMFLAFFPLLLLALGLLGGTSLFPEAIREIPSRLMQILPPGSARVVAGYFVRRTIHPGRWILLGLGGTLLAGTQTMVGLMEGFRVIEGDLMELSYWRRQARALGLLCLTIVPMLAVVVLTVFGKQLRTWLIQHTASPHFTHYVEWIGYAVGVFVLAMAVLVLLYRIGRPGHPASGTCCLGRGRRRFGGRLTFRLAGTFGRCRTTCCTGV